MSSLGDALGRGKRRRPAAPSSPPAAPPVSASSPPSPVPASDERSDLRRRRDALAEQVIELHWDLGGLTYEMATRDHFRLDVLVRRAAVLQELDAELAELERLLALEESAAVGSCPSCGAPHSRGALFCWQCGTTLMERASSDALAEPPPAVREHQGSAAVMDALIAPERRR